MFQEGGGLASNVVHGIAGRLIALPSAAKVVLVASADFIVLIAVAAVCLRLDLHLWPWQSEHGMHPFLLLAPSVTVPILVSMGAYRYVVRFIGADQLLRLIGGVTLGGFLILALASLFSLHLVRTAAAALYVTAGATALVAMRGLVGYALRPHRRASGVKRVLIYGAGDAGAQLAAALARSQQYEVAGFIDDNPRLHGRMVHGRRVYAPAELPALRERGTFRKILLAMPTISRQRQREILNALEPLAVKVLAMPRLEDLAAGRRRVDDLQEVRIEDLLGRDPVPPLDDLLDAFIHDKVVLITGAGGSIGSELARLAVARGARRLVLLEQSEFALYNIHRELEGLPGRTTELAPVLGNVLDRRYVESVMREHHVSTVYHAAAYKHVPLVEQNPLVAVQNNVIGTLSTAEAAMACGVPNFVLISTDKAVRPTSVMGASKRVCELIVQGLAQEHPHARLSMVRFGNVLGSSGSVVPLFREQIRNGGPVTVTHAEVTRYFMTISEAAQLVVQAGAMGRNGEVFVLDMGQPVRIAELAERMIHLSGLRVRTRENAAGDIEIRYTGLRPGEKLYEELLIGNQPRGTDHARIFRANEAAVPWHKLRLSLETMEVGIRQMHETVVMNVLRDLVPGFEQEVADHSATLTPKPAAKPGLIIPAKPAALSTNEDLAAPLAQH
jgi:FlaA1/EpsC-like NDP-sugar epimerase